MPLFGDWYGVKKEIGNLFCGISGVKREMSKMYAGINGVQREIFSSESGLYLTIEGNGYVYDNFTHQQYKVCSVKSKNTGLEYVTATKIQILPGDVLTFTAFGNLDSFSPGEIVVNGTHMGTGFPDAKYEYTVTRASITARFTGDANYLSGRIDLTI